MSRLIETIRLLDGEFQNLPFHEHRIRKAWTHLFEMAVPWDISEILRDESVPPKGLYKCRLTYDKNSQEITFSPYVARQVDSLKLIHDDTIVYNYKFMDRSVLESAFEKRDECDDVLIVKNGLLTDTSYANIILKKGNEWFTPAACLLEGTMRAQLIDKRKVIVEEIAMKNLEAFQKFKLINSMLLDEGPAIDISHIVH